MLRRDDARILLYSHDTFGLGHLRRCREIAHALVEAYRGLSVMIISGATIAGHFDYRTRVDFVKIPSVIKLRNGEYTSMAKHTSLEDTLAMRRAMIRQTAEAFRPDIFITDKEPMGLHGEIEETLHALKARGTHLVLGLREVMDAPQFLRAEWGPKDMLRRIEAVYDTIWVYGPEGFHDPMAGLEVSDGFRARMRYTGFLERSLARSAPAEPRGLGDYLLVTGGGGGDGEDLFRDVLAAYDADPGLGPCLFVLGPYLPARQRAEVTEAARRLPHLRVIGFDNRMEDLVAGAQGVVGMCGYNTFCEIVSFDRPALVVPRTQPRMEQAIRARRAADLGLLRLMMPEEAADPLAMAAALRALREAPPPSQAGALRPEDMAGLSVIASDVGDWLAARHQPQAMPG